jgi:hypothetical protein
MEAQRITFEVPDTLTAQRLLALAEALPGVTQVQEVPTGEWDSLPADLRAELEQALAEADRGEGISWEEFEQKISTLYPELK